MTDAELTTRIDAFNAARAAGLISAQEWEQLMTTLAKIAQGKPKRTGRR
jgi:hypothetical protein